MMDAKYLHLSGYFDRNFGDDMMMKLIVRSLPEITFLVEDTVDTPLVLEPNVVMKDRETCGHFPKLIVTGSGFMINTRGAFLTELIWFLKGRHPGDYCLGCNMEPLDNPIKRFLIRKKLDRFKLITCRDRASYDWLRRNTRRPEIHCLPDILFSIPEEWLPVDRPGNALGISLMHRPGDREDCAYYCAMAKIADEWISKTGRGVILMAFDTGKEDDLFACQAVRSLMQFPDGAEIVAHHDGTEIPAAFARCEKIIAARFHAAVLALRMGIPFFPLIFREKMRNLLSDMQYPIPVCDLDDIDEVSLRIFLRTEKKSYHLEKDTFERACQHPQRLKQRLAQWQDL